MHEKQVLAPHQVGEVQQLRPETSLEIKLTPETEVLCVHRGRESIDDMFDSQHYTILPGFFRIQLGAARHFKARAVVPGSRNPEIGKGGSQASFIAIIGVAIPTADGLRIEKPIDDASEWEPFTDEECQAYGMAVEAIDRDALTDPIDGPGPVQLMGVSGGQITGPASRATTRPRSRVKAGGGGGSHRSRGATRIEGTGAKALAAKNAPGENEATRQIGASLAAAQGRGDAASLGGDD